MIGIYLSGTGNTKHCIDLLTRLLCSHLIGLFGQRLWFYRKTTGYTDKLKIHENCIGCGLCVSLCPMKNISLNNGKAVADKKCTMCYRCISHCPKKAITLLGNEIKEQCQYEKYH